MKKQANSTYDRFIDFILDDDIEGVKSLIDYVDPNIDNAHAMRVAISNGKKNIVKFLEPYIDFNESGVDLLIYASAGGDIEIVKRFVEKYNFNDDDYTLGILNAGINDRVDVASYLIDNFKPMDDYEWEPMISDLASVRCFEILEKCVNKFHKYQKYFSSGTSAFILARAIEHDRMDNFKLLLKYVNPQCHKKLDYLMHKACEQNQREAIDLLFNRDDVDVENVLKMTEVKKNFIGGESYYGVAYLKSLIKTQKDKKMMKDSIQKNKPKQKVRVKKI